MTAIIAALAAVPRWVWKLLAVLLFAWLAYSWAYERGAASREAEIDQWRAAAKAGVEANTANQATIAGLRSRLYLPKISPTTGQLQEWMEDKVDTGDPQHRHLSPLIGWFEGERIADYQDYIVRRYV